ncbi:MAG: hypothetical protein ACI9W4_001748 [Rhodothermales bacterium]|jgi:hypothetical protein
MRLTATSRWLSPLVMTAIMAVWAVPVSAQVDLGEEFIFFVDGVNVLVPANQGSVVGDPVDGSNGNKALSFPYGDWASVSLAFEPIDVGADMTGMVSEDPAATKTLYLKLLVDPALAGRGMCTEFGDACASISFFDAIGGEQTREALESGAGDPQMRLKWFIPEDLKDGLWHDLAIPLPPTTLAALEDARTAGTLDAMQAGWHYTGAWAGGFGVGFGGETTNDPAWQEFQWGNVSWFGIHYDFADGGGGGVFMDDVYIGDANTDLAAGAGAPAAMSGATFSANGGMNRVEWTHNPDFGGYNIYADTEAITTARLDAGELSPLGTVAFNAAEFGLNHAYEVPHGSMAPMDLYYAVTSTSQFGVENTDVSASNGVVANSELAVQPFIAEIQTGDADLIFDNLLANAVAADGFPAGASPFGVNAAHSKAGDGPLPATDEDMSANVWVAFNREYEEIYMYAEITDDVLARHPGTSTCNGCETWGYDSMEFGWGSYDVRDVTGGSVIAGSPHQDFGRGVEADVQLRIGWLGTGEVSTFVSTITGAEGEGEITGAKTVFVETATGYNFLTLMPWNSFVFGSTGDSPFVPPAVDAVKLIPFNIAINDGDGEGQNPRDVQMQWSNKPNAGGGWWNTPSMWMTVAVAGSATPTANEEGSDLPSTFALGQNYPNPFNPSTTIDFNLASSQNVNLSVYNVLGQKVATLIDGEMMASGRHQVQFNAISLTTGMYLVRLDAGTAFTQTKSMMLLK